jgi:3-oxoadipate enol-lactonase
MPYVTAGDGVRLWYEDTGNRDGPVIVFAHEFGGDPRSWNDQVAHFSPDCRCIRYAARGFEPSDIPAERTSYGQLLSTADLETLADHLELDGFHLAGCSMGAFTSLMFALAHPRRLASLTLCGVSSGPTDDERADYHAGLTTEIDMLVAEAAEGSRRWFAEDSSNATLAARFPERFAAYLERTLYQSHHGALMTVSTLHWDRLPLWPMEPQIAAIQARTLLIHGTTDLPRVAQASAWLARVIADARDCPVEGAGHLVQVEEPERFNAELRSVIERKAP